MDGERCRRMAAGRRLPALHAGPAPAAGRAHHRELRARRPGAADPGRGHGFGQRPHRPRDLRRRRARPRHRHDGALLGRAAVRQPEGGPPPAARPRLRRRRPAGDGVGHGRGARLLRGHAQRQPDRALGAHPRGLRHEGAGAPHRRLRQGSAAARTPRHARGRADRRRHAADRQPRAGGQPRLPRDHRRARDHRRRRPLRLSRPAGRLPPGAGRVPRLLARRGLRRPAAVQPAHAGRDPTDREAVARAQRRARDVPRAPARRPEAARRRARRPAGARAGRPLPHLPDGPHQAQGRALLDPLPLQPHDPHDRLPLPRARPQADRLRLQHRLLAGTARHRHALSAR